MTSQEQSDTQRRLHNLATYGTIAAVDHAQGKVRVSVAGRLTDWLPAPGTVGQNFRAWTPMRIGTQVLVTSPSGDPANGVVSQVLYSQGLPPPGNTGDTDIIEFNDDTRFSYDSEAHAAIIDVTAAGKITVRVGAASIDATTDGMTMAVGGSSITINAAGVFLSGPTVGMTAGNGAGDATLSGNFAMRGQLAVTGNVSATGTVMDTGGNSNHHSH